MQTYSISSNTGTHFITSSAHHSVSQYYA